MTSEIGSAQVAPVGGVYLFLARCFSYPQVEFMRAMQEHLRALVVGLPFDVNFPEVPSPTLSQGELESEYIDAFDLNPSCPLYESEYGSGGRTDRDIVQELLRFYGHFGVKLNEKEKDYPDHLVAELEFMAFLAGKEADSSERGKDPSPYRLAQRDFLERHLGVWVGEFDEKVQKNVRDPFYRAASTLLAELVTGHLSHLRR